ncbi:4571_t:CDS:2, partial [Acaulospora colombiana]
TVFCLATAHGMDDWLSGSDSNLQPCRTRTNSSPPPLSAGSQVMFNSSPSLSSSSEIYCDEPFTRSPSWNQPAVGASVATANGQRPPVLISLFLRQWLFWT